MVGRKRVRNPASKDMILDAAKRVVTSRGPAHLTLDAVAAEAGLSKGGLLYNFPSKKALIQGMILTHVEQYRKAFAALRSERHDEPNSVICALVRARKETGIERSVGLAMLAGLAEDPELLSPLRAEIHSALADVRENATDPTLATLVLLAFDGLEFLELLDISPFDAAGRRELEDQMAELVSSGRTGASAAMPDEMRAGQTARPS